MHKKETNIEVFFSRCHKLDSFEHHGIVKTSKPKSYKYSCFFSHSLFCQKYLMSITSLLGHSVRMLVTFAHVQNLFPKIFNLVDHILISIHNLMVKPIIPTPQFK